MSALRKNASLKAVAIEVTFRANRALRRYRGAENTPGNASFRMRMWELHAEFRDIAEHLCRVAGLETPEWT